jgi:hypothetical protein
MLPNKTNIVRRHNFRFYQQYIYVPTVSFHLYCVNMAAVRLRKAFRYPEESDEREELDEEEQERVIDQLQSQNDARNAQYSVHIVPT